MKTLFAIAVTLISLNFSQVEAKRYSILEIQKFGAGQGNVDRSSMPLLELSCLGCISPRSGMPRTNYVRPHFNSGRLVGGYWRS